MIDPVYDVATDLLRVVKNPFETPIWGTWILSRDDVTLAIHQNRFENKPFSSRTGAILCDFELGKDAQNYHSERVAYLVVNPAEDPINIEVIDDWGHANIFDGHHRLAAAIYRGDPIMRVVYGGYCNAFYERFLLRKIKDPE